MKDWFAGLQPRERVIFIGGGIVALVIVLWMFVLRPLGTSSEVLRESVASKQRLLVNLSQIEGLAATPQSTVTGQEQTLVRLVGNSATEHGVALTRQRPDGPDGIQVTFGSASFDTLVAWLVALETQYSVSVESASFTGTRQPGIVNGQLLLRR